MFNQLLKNTSKIEESIKKISSCEIYRNLKIDDELNKILLTERVRKESRKKIKQLYFTNRLFLVYFAMKLNAKFRFKYFKFTLEIIHLYLECYKLFSISKNNYFSTILEVNRFEEVENSLIFTPSFKSYLLTKRENNFSHIKHVFPVKTLYLKKLTLSKSISKYIYYLPVKWLEKAILLSRVNTVKLGGTMNIFNRILALIAIENDIEVIIKDHGLVRDCCAEYAIFTKHKGFNHDSSRAKKERHLITDKF